MKHSLILLAALLLILSSCRKGSDIRNNSLYGTWELRKSSGGFVQQNHEFPAGNGHLVAFSEESYIFRERDHIEGSGYYHVQHNDVGDFIVYSEASSISSDRFTISGDTLTLIPVIGDFSTRQYLKISNNPVSDSLHHWQ